MTRRHYVNNAPQQTLASSITNSAATCAVAGTFSGWPTQFPFYATIDLGQLSEEIVLVTNITGTTASITRAQDGTAAVSHTAGATIDFTVGAADFDEANAHVNANAGVHGVSGNVVGDSDNQTLTNKTLTDPTVNGAAVSGAWTGTVNATGLTLDDPIVNAPVVSNPVSTGDATHPALVGKATTSGGKTLSLENSSGTEKLGVDDAGNLTTAGGLTASGNATITGAVSGKTVGGAVVPTSFTNEAAATAALPSPATGTIVWLTAPTNGGLAGPFAWSGSAWLPVNMRTVRGQFTQTTGIGQSLTASAFTTLTGFAADFDSTGGTFTPSTGTWTCGVSGTYLISGQVTCTSGAARLIPGIQKNGGANMILGAYQTGTSTTEITGEIAAKEITLVAGDTINLAANINTTGIVTATNNGNPPFFRIERIS